MKNNIDNIELLMEIAKDSIKFEDPTDDTQFAYNEGIEDLIIKITETINIKTNNI